MNSKFILLLIIFFILLNGCNDNNNSNVNDKNNTSRIFYFTGLPLNSKFTLLCLWDSDGNLLRQIPLKYISNNSVAYAPNFWDYSNSHFLYRDDNLYETNISGSYKKSYGFVSHSSDVRYELSQGWSSYFEEYLPYDDWGNEDTNAAYIKIYKNTNEEIFFYNKSSNTKKIVPYCWLNEHQLICSKFYLSRYSHDSFGIKNSEDSLCIFDINNLSLKPIVPLKSFIGKVYISPNASKIIFTTSEKSNNVIIYDFYTNLINKFSANTNYSDWFWSPDSKYCIQLAAKECMIINAEMSQKYNLPAVELGLHSYGANSQSLKQGVNYHPMWSPDGKKIVLDYSDAGVQGVAILNNDGSGFQKLTFNGGVMPIFTPFGDKIIYYLIQDNNMHIMNVDGSNNNIFYHEPIYNIAFSPIIN